MRRASRAGVTLIELLIAISLVSLISVGILMALRVGLNAMEKVDNRIMGNRRILGVQRVLSEQIAGMIVTTADCRADPSSPPVRLPFFQGQPRSMRFVSSYSLEQAHRGYPQILEYQVIPNPEGQGVRLVVNELLYSGPKSTGRLCVGNGPPDVGVLFRPIRVGPRSFVLADKLAVCSFGFLQKSKQNPNRREWVPVWTNKEFPLAIRVEMRAIETPTGGIPLVSFVAPVHVNRIPGLLYED